MVIPLLLLLGFLINIFNHGNILIAILNVLLLFFSICFYLKFSGKEFGSIRSPYLVLLAAIPLFTYKHDFFSLLSAIGIFPLFLLLLNTKLKKVLIVMIFFYLVIASFYANGIISFPFSFRPDQLISADFWINLNISQMQKQALYLPHKLRPWVFNSSVYFYVLLSKTAGLFMIKNLYDILLIANLYPLIKGLVLDLKNWDKSKSLIILSILVVGLTTASSRSVNISNSFVFLGYFLLYFILRGFTTINKKVYLLLFIFSLVIATSPYR